MDLILLISEKIEKLFKNHGYKVKSYTNIDEEKILKKVKDFSNTKNIDRFICFLSSHGNETSLACPDGGVVLINDILSAANTKQLENKPKVFFIDACRKYIVIIHQFNVMALMYFHEYNELISAHSYNVSGSDSTCPTATSGLRTHDVIE